MTNWPVLDTFVNTGTHCSDEWADENADKVSSSRTQLIELELD